MLVRDSVTQNRRKTTVSRPTTFAILAVAIAGFAMSLPASAAVKWTFQSGYCVGPCSGANMVFAPSFESNGDDGNNVSVTSWANTDPGTTNNVLAPAALNQYGGGLGVTNADTAIEGDSTSPEHAMDNQDRFDVMLLDFGGQEINLSEIQVGFRTDGDISVLAWTGSGIPDSDGDGTPDVDGAEYHAAPGGDSLLSNGWELIGNYDVNTSLGGSVYSQDVDTDVSSSYWLIGAYNPVFDSYGCSAGDICSYGSTKYDHVKLLALKGFLPDLPPPSTSVPEPLSVLLLAGGLVPLAWRRRRLQQAAEAG